jgi:hypothetical protein
VRIGISSVNASIAPDKPMWRKSIKFGRFKGALDE